MDIYQKSLEYHKKYQGKIQTSLKAPCENKADLALAYTPGVARISEDINQNEADSYIYTNRQNTVAVISDGTAVLGLGDIGPSAAYPVMEGKAMLFKKFADIDAIPIVLDTKDTNKIIDTCKILAKSFGGINLEDISAPRCVEIERRLIEELDIPVFHDDQHGTAIVVLAGIINSLKLVNKKPSECKVVISGCGAAGSNVIRILYNYGFKNIIAFDKAGCLRQKDKDQYDFLKKELLEMVNQKDIDYKSLSKAMEKADIFIGMSVGNILTKKDIKSMNEKAIVFALANPLPEITYQDAKQAGAYIVSTGRSDCPNQVNNLLAFPYIFKGALLAKATRITMNDMLSASYQIASIVEDIRPDNIIPDPFDKKLKTVIQAVYNSCIKGGYVR